MISSPLREEIDLNSRTGDIDALLAGCDPRQWLPKMRNNVLVDYLGFPFWGVDVSDDAMAGAYLADVLERIVSWRTKSHQLHELLAWNWKAARERIA
jgi:hypothetical protein